MNATPYKVRTENFEVDQYVRVQLSNGRSEIGVVVSIDEPGETAVIATRHGYDITVRLSSVRRAFLVVLDLNGVLVARGRGSFVHRPGVEEFISFVMNNFVVAVWTSGLERSSNPIIDKVFDGYQDRLLFKLYRDSCTVLPTPEKPYCTIKNLQCIFDKYPKSFHAVNTIIVDDSPDKCSHPDIALCPVPFNNPEKQENDNGLALAMEVLKEVLRLESHEPLIRASEERLVALAKNDEKKGKEREEQVAIADINGDVKMEGNRKGLDKTDVKNSSGLPEVFLWATRLCCDHISGRCTREDCRFSHDPDDGKRPCSRKGMCRRGHSHRWTNDPHAKGVTASAPAHREPHHTPSPFDASNIVSLFSTNPDQHRQQRHRQHDRDYDNYEHLRQEQSRYTPPPPPPPPRQRQQQQQQQQQKRKQKAELQQEHQQQHSRQHQDGRGKNGREDRIPQKKNVSFHGTAIEHKLSDMMRLSCLQQRQTDEGRVPTHAAPRAAPVRFTSDSNDGGAILRHLQAALSSGIAPGVEDANGRSNRRRHR